ncbi:hypothetical protein BKA57DRAFT_451040 [Linnemannia elongata]|nr:hypothetical protein BKA57DRAFT_451040 [Linnemannia elongata]
MTPMLFSSPLPPSLVFSILLYAHASRAKKVNKEKGRVQSAECTVPSYVYFRFCVHVCLSVCVCNVSDTVCREEQAQVLFFFFERKKVRKVPYISAARLEAQRVLVCLFLLFCILQGSFRLFIFLRPIPFSFRLMEVQERKKTNDKSSQLVQKD